jgi:hypothetical protein
MLQMLRFMPGLYGNRGVDVNEKCQTSAANGVQTANDDELTRMKAGSIAKSWNERTEIGSWKANERRFVDVNKAW